ncbi:hypothetical protein IU459_08180 [Nocardia amamiensis]|uniref:Uncharacterized protein n=1 Tax=Nocardia amamiensis TaxID=404578 RepID=A0ABS0CLN2_9NOCA|nr:hypothetical protein [Nocardia amamiensis]MBF6297520.1 hypothetical protein [Nocardia amamiensis]
MKKIGSPLMDALETVWAAIQARHPDTPDVVVTMAAGSTGRSGGVRLGRFGPDRWEHGTELMPELFVGCEGFAASAEEVLGTVLHYAAHGIARTRAVKDTSRAGAYHNGRYKEIAEEIGLTVERAPGRGWATTTLAKAISDAYRGELPTLAAALVAHRLHETGQTTGADAADENEDDTGKDTGEQRAPRGGCALVCRCDPPRRVRAFKRTIDAGPILCGVCQDPFHVDLSTASEAGHG